MSSSFFPDDRPGNGPDHRPDYGIDTINGIFGAENSPAVIAFKRDHLDWIAILEGSP